MEPEVDNRLRGAMLAVVLLLAAWGILRDCHIQVNFGLGYDGEAYGAVALRPATIFEVPFNRVARLLPSFLVNAAQRALGMPRTVGTVIVLFTALNLCLVLASLLVWFRIVA